MTQNRDFLGLIDREDTGLHFSTSKLGPEYEIPNALNLRWSHRRWARIHPFRLALASGVGDIGARRG